MEIKEPISLIEKTDHVFNLFKFIPLSNGKIKKVGLTIHRDTLKMNSLGSNFIDFYFQNNMANDENRFQKSYANLGFINIKGKLVFLYANKNGIYVQGNLIINDNSIDYLGKRRDILHFSGSIINKTEEKELKEINQEFRIIQKYLNNLQLHFFHFPQIDSNIFNQIYSTDLFKYDLSENYRYNENYADFSRMIQGSDIFSPIIRGYMDRLTFNAEKKKEDCIDMIIRNKIIDNNYLIEVVLFVGNKNNYFYQNVFYLYFYEPNNKEILQIKNLLKLWESNYNKLTKDNDKYELITINLYDPDNNKINIEEEINNLEEEIKKEEKINKLEINKINVKINNEKFFNDNEKIFKEIGFDYHKDKINKSQNKLLIIFSNNINEMLSFSSNVSLKLYNLFLTSNNLPKCPAPEEFCKRIQALLKKNITKFSKNQEVKIEFIKDIEKINDNNNTQTLGKDIKIEEQKKNEKLDDQKINKNEIIEIKKHKKKISIFIGTFNVNAENPSTIENLNEFLFPITDDKYNYFESNNYPTFYCIGLEEIVDLNIKNIIINKEENKNSADLWEKEISNKLQEKFNYFLLYRQQLVGVLLLVYVQSKELRNITDLHQKIYQIGLGNKGCCLLEFKYLSKKFGFCSGHLPHGQKAKNKLSRKEALTNLLNYKVNKEKLFYENDYYFIFGDLNFRNQTEYLKEMQNLVKTKPKTGESRGDPGKTKEELKKEESKIYMDENTFGKEYFFKILHDEEFKKLEKELKEFEISEPGITFYPSYKYEKGSDLYNISKRIPSWTDRILYKKKKGEIAPAIYQKICSINKSDHKPLVGLFNIEI